MLVCVDAWDPRRRFPATAPMISVEASEQRLGPIDCRELQWWHAIPRLGDRSAFAAYNVDTGELDFAHEVVSIAPVSVDGRDAVELMFNEWSRETGRIGTDRFTCVLDQDRARWLTVTLHGGGARTLTKGDPEFDAGWADTGPRRLVDSGRYQQLADGAYRTTGTPDMGAGVYRVQIGARVFTCLRVIDLTPFGDESAELGVAFVEPGGRTVLYREYSTSTLWDDDWQVWRAAHPGREIVVDDNLFLQRDCTGRAHDVLTAASMDISRAHALAEP